MREFAEKMHSGEYIREWRGYDPFWLGCFYGTGAVLGGERKFSHCCDFFSGIGDVTWWIVEEINKLTPEEQDEMESLMKRNKWFDEVIKDKKISVLATLLEISEVELHRIDNKSLYELFKTIYDTFNGILDNRITDPKTLLKKEFVPIEKRTRRQPHLPPLDDMPVIEFYRQREVPYGCFSNFSRHPVGYMGELFPTAEHLYQALKFWSIPEYVEQIKNAKTPKEAAILGRTLQPLRDDWERIKIHVMYDVVYQKFNQHQDLKEILLSTKNATLVEHTTNDSFWGDGGDGSGKNMLGKVLMLVRDAIRLFDRK